MRIDKMRLIYRVEVNGRLNKKASELAAMAPLYRGCMFPTEECWLAFVRDVKSLVENLNKHFGHTKPFEVYGDTDKSVYICVEGDPETWVARFSGVEVVSVLDHIEGEIVPVEDYELKRIE